MKKFDTLINFLLETFNKETLEDVISRHSDMKILFNKTPDGVFLSGMWAKENAPPKTGTMWMQDLTEWADNNNKIIRLETGSEIDQPPNGYKATTNRNRLISFYKRFGFVGREVMTRNAGRSLY